MLVGATSDRRRDRRVRHAVREAARRARQRKGGDLVQAGPELVHAARISARSRASDECLIPRGEALCAARTDVRK